MRVLVTGAAGSIGRTVVPGLAERGHDVVALDRVDFSAPAAADVVVADVLDAEAVGAAMRGAAGVVHLATVPGETDLAVSMESHVLTTATLLDAMVEQQVRRLVLASSNHAVGRTPRTDLLPVETRPRPDTFYGVGKVAAEALGSLYVDRHGMSVVACRIGTFQPEPASRRALSTWLSPGDAVRMVEAGLTAPEAGFAVLYGISANTRAWWDLEPGRRLGYEPQDDAETFADRVLSEPETASDRFDATYVGGSFAGDTYARPAVPRP
jgi:uronate dehydrogenase